MFVDEVDIEVRAGRGGDGCMAFLREKYRPMGGPAGGDGGNGGSIWFEAHPGLRTLADFRGKRVLVAKNGAPGEGKNKHGKSARKLFIKVPIGTIIRDLETGNIIADLTIPRQKVEIAKGGRGGRGNQHFATPTHRTPRNFERGTPGELKKLRLELRLLADVGLVGLPNAGKSTLIGAVSTVKPEVADYPFTTLRPSVGVVRLGDQQSFTMADIPGLIELAHEGKGLGHQFLRHIQRTSVICHLVEVPMYAENHAERYAKMVDGYRIIRNELSLYSEKLAAKPEIVCITKIDILPDEDLADFRENYLRSFTSDTNCPEPLYLISSVRGDGISSLLGYINGLLNSFVESESKSAVISQYIDGEPPESLPMRELSMETLNDMEAGKQ